MARSSLPSRTSSNPIPLSRRKKLCARALSAQKRAYAPYSRFLVGASLWCGGEVFVDGANVENASYGLCICAERTAISTAVAAGKKKFLAIAIATNTSPPSPPCGMCRQVLSEFCQDLVIFLVNPQGEITTTTLTQLFPGTFTPDALRAGQRRKHP